MISIIWRTFGLFFEPRHTLVKLQNYHSNDLFKAGIILSITAILSQNISSVLDTNTVSPMLIVRLIPYYLITFICLSVTLSIYGMIKEQVNFIQFFGIYLLTDFPLILIFPLSMIGLALNIIAPIISIIIGFIVCYVVFLKIVAVSALLKVSFIKASLLVSIPFIFVGITAIIGIIDVFQKFFL